MPRIPPEQFQQLVIFREEDNLKNIYNMVEKSITILYEHGLHARPAAMFVETANKFSSGISISNESENSGAVNAKSILGVLTLGVNSGHVVHVVAEGPDEQAALEALIKLIEGNFNDMK